MHQRLTISILMLSLLACGRSVTKEPDEPEPSSEKVQPSQSSQPAAPHTPAYGSSTIPPNPLTLACVPLQGICGAEANVTQSCCGGARCIELSVYDWRRCSMGKADGAFCYQDDQCQSGSCENSQCVTPVCKAIGQTCLEDADCCGGSFCDDFVTYGYGFRWCRAPQVNGSSCSSDSQCQSGICHDYQCSANACNATGTTCGTDADCCSGLFCDNLTYAPVKCRAPLANGLSCNADSHCQSGNCKSYQCAASVCTSAGATCGTDADCCSGLFCDNLTYAPVKCRAPLANGHSCNADSHCQSGNCKNYQCAAAVCSPAGAACTDDADCCSGTWCNNMTYAAWTCLASLPKGSWCLTAQQCSSGSCAANQCQ